MNSINIGDVVFQLICFGLLVLFVLFIVWLFRSNKKRIRQLNRIEKKIEEMDVQIKKGYNGRQ
ncbi:DUF4083 domain-containing protein [Bacillus smithii]|jgi:energy-converting hydrogenase Eha subunit H|uniref:DUF4083 domain-containing protein n=1 Tax=Bacillus smithii TaxID=1479 RepID=UPI002E20272C|nr:DUF4083 domain-containing protein [Bacillus smithii]MED4927050.1 DUF4083 domain-containing protein [Bacillus smithii]